MPPLLYWGQRLFSPLFLLYQKTPPLGAYTTVHVATCPKLRGVGGQYFVNSQPTDDVHPLARDPTAGERLWAVSEAAVGLGGGGQGNGHGNGNGHVGAVGTPSRARHRKALPSSSSSGGGGGGGGDGSVGKGKGSGSRSSTPQRRRGPRKSPFKGKLS